MKLVESSVLGIALVTAVLVGSGCASQRMQEGPEKADEERVCIKVRQIHSMETVDDYHVLARVSAADYYLITVERGCPGLGFAAGVSLVNPSMRICGDGADFISYQNPEEASRRCRIVKIESVDSKKGALGLIESRKPREDTE